MDIINNLLECTGCTACAAICPHDAIVMEQNTQGFLYPVINDDKCSSCNLCVKICPGNNDLLELSNEQKVFAVKHVSEKVRHQSSSGGFFTGLYEYIINQNGVVFGVCFNNKMEVVHTKSETIDGCKKFRGSKYVQSTKNEIFKNVKQEVKTGKLVLFTGTPCEVAGLNAYLQKKYINLLTCDFICHGVPSPGVWNEYVSYINRTNNSRLVSYSFRSKSKGWRTACIRKDFINGKRSELELPREPFGYLFANDLILRNSCHKCRYANLNRVSDITMGDYWSIEHISKSFNDNIGISQVTLNSNHGSNVFKLLLKNFNVLQTSINDYLPRNFREPTPPNPVGENLWNDYQVNGFEYIINKYRPRYTVVKQILKWIGVFNIVINLKNKIRKSTNC